MKSQSFLSTTSLSDTSSSWNAPETISDHGPYLTMVRPKMARNMQQPAVWDLYYQSDIQHYNVELVFINDYSTYSSVTDMLKQLSWPTLQIRRKTCRLQTLFVNLL